MPHTVLLVDDSQQLLDVTRARLEEAGYKVVTATSGQAALEIFGSIHCDAVVLDYDMPDFNGAILARQMYALNRYASIIMFSGVDSIPPDALRYVDGLVRKGESGTELLRQLQRMLGAAEVESIFERAAGEKPAKATNPD